MRLKIILALSCMYVLGSCNSGTRSAKYENQGDATASATAVAPDSASVKVAYQSGTPEKKIIHTANYKCNVKNVFTSVRSLESLVKSMGGEIQESNMENTAGELRSVERGDSIIQYHTYTTTANLVLKAPAANFDSVVHAIPALASYIDARNVKERDVTLQFMGNQLRAEAGSERLAELKNKEVENKDDLAIAEYKDRVQDGKTTHELSNLGLQNDVAYATILVQFSQPEQIFTETIVNPDAIADGNFGAACTTALNWSMALIKGMLLLLLYIWPLLLLIPVTIFALRRYRQYSKKGAKNAMQMPIQTGS